MIKVRESLAGKRFGRLVVLEQSDDYISSGKKFATWKCLCDCGNISIIRQTSLKYGSTKSCGCYQKENMSAIKKDYNLYVHKDGYYIGKTNNGEEFYFSDCDYDLIKNYCWSINHGGYVVTTKPNDKRLTFMHKLIIGELSEGFEVDHINHDRKDNRRTNLRICLAKDNSKNKKTYKTNKTGVSGVYYNKKTHKWVSQISVDSRRLWLGSFDNINDAIIARLNAEKQYYKEYSPQKDLYKIFNC